MEPRPAPHRSPGPRPAVRAFAARRVAGSAVVAALVALVTPVALVAIGAFGGCAARPDRFAAFRDEPTAAPPDVRRGELTGRGGYASLGARVRLRDDTPPLTPIVEAERAASLPPTFVFEPIPEGPCGPYGPEGAPGAFLAAGDFGYVSPYLLPGGAIDPGFRRPLDLRPSPFAPVYHASPAADVWRHRPGLSTGSGVYARPRLR